MMKPFGLAAACMLVVSAASAQVQSSAPGSGAANHAGVGYNQTQQPPVSGPSGQGPTTSVQSSAPGSGAANHAGVGYNQTLASPATGHGVAESTNVQTSAPGSGAANNAGVGYNQTQTTK